MYEPWAEVFDKPESDTGLSKTQVTPPLSLRTKQVNDLALQFANLKVCPTFVGNLRKYKADRKE